MPNPNLSRGSQFKRHGGESFDPEAATLFAAMSPAPSAARQELINAWFVGIKADFNVASISEIFDIFYMLAAHDSQAAGLNWVNPATFALSPVNSPTFEVDRGYTGDGSSSYLNTGWTPSTDGVRYTLNNASMGVYSRTNLNVNTVEIGAASGLQTSRILMRTAGNLNVGINRNAGFGVAVADSLGLAVGDRSASNSTRAYKNGVDVGGETNASTSLVTQSLFLCATNNDGGGGSLFSTRQIANAHAGRSLTADEHLALFNRNEAFLDAIGAGVVT